MRLRLVVAALVLTGCGTSSDVDGDAGADLARSDSVSDARWSDARLADAGRADARPPKDLGASDGEPKSDGARDAKPPKDLGVTRDAAPKSDTLVCTGGATPYQGKCAHRLRVSSYNIAAYMYKIGTPSTPLYGNPEPQLQKIAATIKSRKIDVIGLQEVENNATWHANVHMHNRLLAILKSIGYPMTGYFQLRFAAHGGQFGISILSRLPVAAYAATKIASQVYLQRLAVTFRGQPVHVFNYHPFPGPTACQHTASAAFKNALAPHLGAVSMLAGDFNLTRASSCFSSITATHVDSCASAKANNCNNTVDLVVRTDIKNPLGIDYVFHRFGAQPAKWRLASVTVDTQANKGLVVSDHFPVHATFVRFQ